VATEGKGLSANKIRQDGSCDPQRSTKTQQDPTRSNPDRHRSTQIYTDLHRSAKLYTTFVNNLPAGPAKDTDGEENEEPDAGDADELPA